jgi:hypothetical protein
MDVQQFAGWIPLVLPFLLAFPMSEIDHFCPYLSSLLLMLNGHIDVRLTG